jgi:16S rRNA (uracil1498-N3)-methyltransferase
VRLPRFFATGLPRSPGASFELTGDEAHHGVHVLRLAPGALVELFDGDGGAGRFEVNRAARASLELRLVERTDEDREARCAVTLAFAPPRPKRTLALVEKATELGVARLVPLLTKRGVAGRGGLSSGALAKLRRRALEAAKQCGRNRLPSLAPSATFDALLAEELPRVELALLPDTRGARPLRETLGSRPSPPRSVLFAVGPEGGFEEEERVRLRAAGFEPVVLGATILRVETAAIAILACLRYELG